MGVLLEGLRILATVVIVLGIITLIIYLIANLDDWCAIKEHSSCNAKMKFSQWLDLYYLNKTEWLLGCTCPSRCFAGQSNIYIEFSFIDFLRYTHWYKHREKHEKNDRKDKNLIKVLEAAQKDIDRAREQSSDTMRAAAEQVEEVSKRVEEYANTPLWALADDTKFAPLVPGTIVWDMENGTYRIEAKEK